MRACMCACVRVCQYANLCHPRVIGVSLCGGGWWGCEFISCVRVRVYLYVMVSVGVCISVSGGCACVGWMCGGWGGRRGVLMCMRACLPVCAM